MFFMFSLIWMPLAWTMNTYSFTADREEEIQNTQLAWRHNANACKVLTVCVTKKDNKSVVLMFAVINCAHLHDFTPLTAEVLLVGHSFTPTCKNRFLVFLLDATHGAFSKGGFTH